MRWKLARSPALWCRGVCVGGVMCVGGVICTWSLEAETRSTSLSASPGCVLITSMISCLVLKNNQTEDQPKLIIIITEQQLTDRRSSPQQDPPRVRLIIRALEDVKLAGEGQRNLHLGQSLLRVWIWRVELPFSCTHTHTHTHGPGWSLRTLA